MDRAHAHLQSGLGRKWSSIARALPRLYCHAGPWAVLAEDDCAYLDQAHAGFLFALTIRSGISMQLGPALPHLSCYRAIIRWAIIRWALGEAGPRRFCLDQPRKLKRCLCNYTFITIYSNRARAALLFEPRIRSGTQMRLRYHAGPWAGRHAGLRRFALGSLDNDICVLNILYINIWMNRAHHGLSLSFALRIRSGTLVARSVPRL